MQRIIQVNWVPSIGDPTFLGWFTVAAYLIAAWFGAKVYVTAEDLFDPIVLRKQKAFWLFIAVMMLFLGINKQLDLQSLLTAIGRYYAAKEGWYEERRKFQMAFIAEIVVISIFTMSIMIRYMKDALKENKFAILGFGFLLMFIIIRASSFHHVDELLMGRIIGVRINWILEISGVSLICYSAFSILKKDMSV